MWVGCAGLNLSFGWAVKHYTHRHNHGCRALYHDHSTMPLTSATTPAAPYPRPPPHTGLHTHKTRQFPRGTRDGKGPGRVFECGEELSVKANGMEAERETLRAGSDGGGGLMSCSSTMSHLKPLLL
ncbi:hypothetical protein E2C01_065324 [Portunus trituberculatus]|uniref:Uncharacterized protein n=1 Tax=Portunus trituberculatus TaxID=210409 RepID=A0A5B7HN28_PORTR|nr:hypothetical protein [Portunus trituberculatus]